MTEAELFPEQTPDMDPYDREERCRKAIRTIGKAIAVRIAACVLLLVAVLRTGAAPLALGLTAFALLVILAGVFPLAAELRKQRGGLNECLQQQEILERASKTE